MLNIFPADSSTFDAALSMALTDVGPQERQLRIETVRRQPAAPGLFTVIRNGNLIGAVYSELRPDKTLLLWPPGTLEGAMEEGTEVRTALYRRIDRYAKETGAGPILAFVEERPRMELEQAGFEYVSDILTLVANEISFPMETDSGRLLFVAGSSDAVFEEMAPLFERTFEKTNDFPKLVGIAPAAEVLRSYQSGGGYRPELWFFAQVGKENVGCLILADHSEFGQLELLYLGILPEHRGRKYAYPLVQHVQQTARRLGRRMVTVAVDSQNQAAIRVYTRCGFTLWSKKSLFFKRREVRG